MYFIFHFVDHSFRLLHIKVERRPALDSDDSSAEKRKHVESVSKNVDRAKQVWDFRFKTYNLI